MKDFQMTPEQWGGLTKLDKKTLHYYQVMENHYIDSIEKKHQKEAKLIEAKQNFLNKLPQQAPRRGR